MRSSKFNENEISKGWKYKAKDPKINEVMSNYIKAKKARNKVYFTPPYNAAVSTNIITFVIKQVAKCFTKEKAPILSKAFNKHSMVCTYCTGRNIKGYIDSHNKGLLRKGNETEVQRPCNCRGGPANCPVEGECWSTNVIYEAEVKAEDSSGAQVEVDGWDSRTYQGQTMEFKQRWYSHRGSFTDPTPRS